MSSQPVQLIGEKELSALLILLPEKVSAKADRQSVAAAARPVVRAVKARVKEESGLLKKAIGFVSRFRRKGKTGVASARIGAKRGVQGEYKGRKRVPSRYFHLVDKGTVKGVKPDRALEEGWAASKGQAERIAQEKYQTVIVTEARKLGLR